MIHLRTGLRTQRNISAFCICLVYFLLDAHALVHYALTTCIGFFLCWQSVCGKMSFLQMKCWWWSLFLAPRMYGALHIVLLDEPVSDFKFEVQVDLFFLGLGLSRLWGCCRLLCLACVRRVFYTTLWSCSLMSMLVLSGQPNQHLPYTNYIHK